MYDAKGVVIYIGKAKNLKNRVSSYFHKTVSTPKTKRLLSQVDDLDITITHSETDALLLESNLIKKLHPRYNVLLRDDKSYPYIYISTQQDFPRMDVYRGARQQKGRYFGPYTSGLAVRETLNLLQKLFKIRSCKDTFFNNRTRPCLQHQIKRCTAPCVKFIDKQTYQADVKNAVLFLEGKNQQIIENLIKQMQQASDDKKYELAAHFRDQISSLRKIQEQQTITAAKDNDIDIIAAECRNNSCCVHVLSLRAGRIIGSKSFFPKTPMHAQEADVLTAFIPQYYLNPEREKQFPQQIILSKALDDHEWISSALGTHFDRKVTLHNKVRGERLKWREMAEHNAKLSLGNMLSSKASTYHRFEALQKELKLDAMPQRLECIDISHTQGEATVASLVVFNQEGPAKSDYRRYNIKGITKGDDYAAIRQALTKRYTKLKSGEGQLPDLLLIDGGKGQLQVAIEVMEELQVTSVLLLGIAKGPTRKAGLETLYFINKENEIHLAEDSIALHLIQHIRDEAHRFAITGHRNQRDKKRTTSPLESIEGVGAKRRQQLLIHFGGLQELKRVSVDEIAKVKGISKDLAKKVYDALH